MSYSIIDEYMLNNQLNNEQQPVKKRDHWNEKNPHYQHPHSPEAKEAISKTQKARWAMLRQIVDNKIVTEERVREIIRETIDDYLKNNAAPIENNKPINIQL